MAIDFVAVLKDAIKEADAGADQKLRRTIYQKARQTLLRSTSDRHLETGKFLLNFENAVAQVEEFYLKNPPVSPEPPPRTGLSDSLLTPAARAKLGPVSRHTLEQLDARKADLSQAFEDERLDKTASPTPVGANLSRPAPAQDAVNSGAGSRDYLRLPNAVRLPERGGQQLENSGDSNPEPSAPPGESYPPLPGAFREKRLPQGLRTPENGDAADLPSPGEPYDVDDWGALIGAPLKPRRAATANQAYARPDPLPSPPQETPASIADAVANPTGEPDRASKDGEDADGAGESPKGKKRGVPADQIGNDTTEAQTVDAENDADSTADNPPDRGPGNSAAGSADNAEASNPGYDADEQDYDQYWEEPQPTSWVLPIVVVAFAASLVLNAVLAYFALWPNADGEAEITPAPIAATDDFLGPGWRLIDIDVDVLSPRSSGGFFGGDGSNIRPHALTDDSSSRLGRASSPIDERSADDGIFAAVNLEKSDRRLSQFALVQIVYPLTERAVAYGAIVDLLTGDVTRHGDSPGGEITVVDDNESWRVGITAPMPQGVLYGKPLLEIYPAASINFRSLDPRGTGTVTVTGITIQGL